MGFCAPVRMTGFTESFIMYDRAAAVYAIVSVPWLMTKPSKSS